MAKLLPNHKTVTLAGKAINRMEFWTIPCTLYQVETCKTYWLKDYKIFKAYKTASNNLPLTPWLTLASLRVYL